jgi:hypothetical protein
MASSPPWHACGRLDRNTCPNLTPSQPMVFRSTTTIDALACFRVLFAALRRGGHPETRISSIGTTPPFFQTAVSSQLVVDESYPWNINPPPSQPTHSSCLKPLHLPFGTSHRPLFVLNRVSCWACLDEGGGATRRVRSSWADDCLLLWGGVSSMEEGCWSDEMVSGVVA